MKIIFLDWNSFGNEDLIEAMTLEGITVIRYPFDGHSPRRDALLESKFSSDWTKESADAVFSFNYYPIVSVVCEQLNLKYISWVYDSPHAAIYSYTIIKPCNHVFLFDRAEYLKFHSQGIHTVHYLPLAANPTRIQALIEAKENAFHADISFIGSLYSEDHDVFKNLTPSPDGIETKEWLQAEYVDARRITSEERIELINAAAGHGETFLFTKSDASVIDKHVKLMGGVDYYSEAPLVFANSKINLCPTLRSIKTGIPLRVFDIMASKGPLLMNYQSDMDEFFEVGEDYFIYTDAQDFEEKLDYMLSHDMTKMVESAFQKLCDKHTYRHRIREMLNTI